MTKNALIETRRVSDRLTSADACWVRLRNTKADPGGLTTGKSAASTNKKVSTRRPLIFDSRLKFNGAYGRAMPGPQAPSHQFELQTQHFSPIFSATCLCSFGGVGRSL